MSGSTASRVTARPRVLMHYPVLNRGGAERSTLRLLKGLADRGCHVELVLTVAGGTLESEVDPRIGIHHLRETVGSFPRDVASLRDVLRFAWATFQWGRGRLQESWRVHRFRRMRFDAAIAGLHGLSPAFICKHVQAEHRLVMVRNDAADDAHGRLSRNIETFSGYIDAYICVSQSVLDSLLQLYPQLTSKAVKNYNLIDPAQMRHLAQQGDNPLPVNPDAVQVLSVCRLQESQKALLRMIEVHRRLLDAGVAHVWHVLGDGPDRGRLEQAIHDADVQASFILHGAVSNPFPWYRHADLVAVLSRYEGLCGVVNEARVLERPVIATRFAGIEEQIDSGVNGLIVEQDVGAICEGMSRLLKDAGLRARLANGGYPQELLDDDAKVEALMRLIAGQVPSGATEER